MWGQASSGFNQPRPLIGQERVLCLNAEDGKVVWKHEHDTEYKVDYPAGPRAAPLVHGDKVYTLGTMGARTRRSDPQTPQISQIAAHLRTR